MPEQNNERLQEEAILAEVSIVRTKQKERQVMMEIHSLSLDEVMGECMELDLAHEEKILTQEVFIMKHRRLQEESVEQPKTVANMEEFIHGILL
jgi:hypothetical protein